MKEYYLVVEDSGEFVFYPKTKEGFNQMAQLFNNHKNRFFEITINKEFKIKYSSKTIKLEKPPQPFFDNEEDIIE